MISARLPILPALLLVTAFSTALGKVSMPAIFGDHMVLQQGLSLPLWGKADPGETIKVTVGSHTAQTKADNDGNWMVHLEPLSGSNEPVAVIVEGTNKLTFEDVLIGDVWVASGQSNMLFGISKSSRAKEDIPKADHPTLRLFLVPRYGSYTPEYDMQSGNPQNSLEAHWAACTPETLAKMNGRDGGFSAVTYYFGSEIQAKTSQPVGLIQCPVGSMPVETFTSLDALKGHLKDYPDFAKNIAELEGLKAQSEQTKSSYPAAKVAYDQQMRDWNDKYGEQYKKTVQEWKAASQAPKANGEPGSRKPPAPPAPMPKAPIEVGAKLGLPTTLFNAMIHPIIPFGIKGVIWYQGESNTDMKIPAKPWSYDKAFAVMINDWRGRWKQGDFPFLFVQLASYGKGMENPVVDMENGFPVIREMQKSTLKLSNTGMAVAIDVGEQNDIHPKDKYDVGHRLALAARRIAYGEDLPFSGPLYDSMKVEGDTIRISFKHAGSGLKIGPHPKIRVDDTPQVPTELGAFAICGSDRNWLAATAKIDGSTVIVSNPEVKSPVAVRYGWSAFPDCHLYNNDGLPASPFRTDDWMGGQPHPSLPKQ